MGCILTVRNYSMQCLDKHEQSTIYYFRDIKIQLSATEKFSPVTVLALTEKSIAIHWKFSQMEEISVSGTWLFCLSKKPLRNAVLGGPETPRKSMSGEMEVCKTRELKKNCTSPSIHRNPAVNSDQYLFPNGIPKSSLLSLRATKNYFPNAAAAICVNSKQSNNI